MPELVEKQACWICLDIGENDPRKKNLIRPCLCNSWVHQGCLQTWRFQTQNPRYAFQCVNCLAEYRFKRHQPDAEQKRTLQIWYLLRVLRFFLILILFIAFSVAAWSLLSWGLDREPKNIPVVMRYIQTSVVSGFPDANSTAECRGRHLATLRTFWFHSLLLPGPHYVRLPGMLL